MATNILIGVGGTGAKIVESVLMGCLAGLGPGHDRGGLSVGLVDQDAGNGNVQRTSELLHAIGDLQNGWLRGGPNSWVSGDAAKGACRLAATPVAAMNTALWRPQADRGASLASIFGSQVLEDAGEGDLKLLFDALYAPGPSEQAMELSEGYRGRPHIGAAAILSQNEDSTPFLRELRDHVRRAKGSEEVRIFLAGSVFGGTGAAGFPTIARMLRSLAGSSGAGGSVRIAGALMLPYFSFDPPEDDRANVARAEELLRQSQAALKYYADLFRAGGERVFDAMYMVGWDPPIPLGYHSPGSRNQANPPLLPELVAAMGALRFFAQEQASGGGEATPVFISARQEASEFSWNDLPGLADEGQARWEHQREFGRLLRFAAVWHNTVQPELRPRGLLEGKPAWYKRSELGRVKFDEPATTDSLRRLNAVVELVLEWAGAIQAFAPMSPAGFKLWDLSPMVKVEKTRDPEDPNHRFVAARAPLSDEEAANAFRKLILDRDQARLPPDQAVLFQEINNAKPPDKHKGLGKIVAAVHHAARLPAATEQRAPQ